MKRPAQITVKRRPAEPVIVKASYVGSPEHKVVRWWGGLPQAYVPPDGRASRPGKQDTTICPLVTAKDREKASGWVREAIRAHQYKFFEGDKDFPKHIWYRDEDGQVWFGFCVNGIAGDYKGWPIDEDERSEIFD